MDFQQRIEEATRYRDQTRDSYARAQDASNRAHSAYDQAFASAPSFGQSYDRAKRDAFNSQEVKGAKSAFDKAKSDIDFIRERIDSLDDSITQQFGGTGLSEAQREAAKRQQNEFLSAQFKQYDATYQTRFADYNKTVEKAFKQSMFVANKDYDSHWEKVRARMTMWQTNLKSEERWQDMLGRANKQLERENMAYDQYKHQQRMLQMNREFVNRLHARQREHVNWMNNFAAQQRASQQSRDSAPDYGTVLRNALNTMGDAFKPLLG